MTRKLVAGIAAGAFALGILTGSAGTIVVGNTTTPNADLAVMADHMADNGMSSMMSMMSMMSGSMMGPDASSMPMDPGDHNAHHASPSPDTSK